MQRRRMDRAQRMRAQRLWWERNGAFVRGAIFGAVITAALAWLIAQIH